MTAMFSQEGATHILENIVPIQFCSVNLILNVHLCKVTKTFILSVHAFHGNQPHDLGMLALYC